MNEPPVFRASSVMRDHCTRRRRFRAPKRGKRMQHLYYYYTYAKTKLCLCIYIQIRTHVYVFLMPDTLTLRSYILTSVAPDAKLIKLSTNKHCANGRCCYSVVRVLRACTLSCFQRLSLGDSTEKMRGTQTRVPASR